MVEPQDMGVDELRPFDNIPDDAAVLRRPGLECVVHAHRGSMTVGCRTYAADALRDVPRVSRVPALEDKLESPKQRSRRPCILDLPAFDLHIDPQMPFDSCHRVYGYSGHYFLPPFFSSVLPDPAVATACTAMPTAVATAATAPILSAPASTPP